MQQRTDEWFQSRVGKVMDLSSLNEALRLDPDTGKLYWRCPPKNHAEKAGREAGFLCKGRGKNKDYWHVRVLGTTVKRSRLVFYMTYGRWPSPCVDHIDGNSLNDKPSNLREVNYRQNAQNSRPYRKRSGLPRGVWAHKGRYGARITVSGKSLFLGYFDTPNEAGQVYEAKRREVFGDFA